MHRKLITALALAAVATASFGATAHADVHPDGYVTVEHCSNVSGTITYTPGLRKKAKAVHAIVQAQISGCVGSDGSPQAGTGTFTAQLSSPAASLGANNESGTFVINWPVGAGLNPTVGNLSIRGPLSNVLTVGGQDTAGAYASG